jgi:DNA modification methylase
LSQNDKLKDLEIGNELSPDLYIDTMVDVFSAVKRVLRGDGVLWLNLGDSYSQAGKSGGTPSNKNYHSNDGGIRHCDGKNYKIPAGNALGIPWRVALALQADGWILRGEMIWQKPSPLPESLIGQRWERCRRKIHGCEKGGGHGHDSLMAVDQRHMSGINETWLAQWEPCPGCEKCQKNDGYVLRRGNWRPTKAHEQIFLLAKSLNYYADGDAVSTPANLRSVLTIPAEPLKGQHFATFPSQLPTIAIKASTSSYGVCKQCGSQYARMVKRIPLMRHRPNALTKRQGNAGEGNFCPNDRAGVNVETTGWRQTCGCDCKEYVPAIVLDPFAGSGTTLVAALRLGRRAIGFDLNSSYVDMARKRITNDNPLFNQI